MSFTEYLAQAPKGEQARIARALRVSPGTVNDWASGRCLPSIGMAVALEIQTKGKVTTKDLAAGRKAG